MSENISNDILVFKVLPFLTSFDSSTKLIDVYNEIKDFNNYACTVYCETGKMPSFEFKPYGLLDSYKTPKMLFTLKDLGLVD